jgi:hypothetical protein
MYEIPLGKQALRLKFEQMANAALPFRAKQRSCADHLGEGETDAGHP